MIQSLRRHARLRARIECAGAAAFLLMAGLPLMAIGGSFRIGATP